MTIHTHNHALTYIHTYIYTDTHNMNTAHIHHHNITYQNITWRIITSHHMQQDQYIYVCIHLYYYHPTSHHTNIISPHTHIHIRITSACTSHILQTASFIRYTYREHTTKVTHLYMYIHTYTHTNSPTITPPSLSYFLFPCCLSMLSLSLVKLLTFGVIRSYNLFFHSVGNVIIPTDELIFFRGVGIYFFPTF